MPKNPEYTLAGVRMKQHLSSEDTHGAFCLFENRSAGPSRTPIHVHAKDDETLYVLEGEMHSVIAGQERVLKAGESVFLPRGVAHQLFNEGTEPAHYLLLCTPGGFEGFLEEGGHRLKPGDTLQPVSEADIIRMKAAAPRFGITLLAEWPEAAA
jgi:mannose-6-phosphate isomerase-like protein (cupin superfamily)